MFYLSKYSLILYIALYFISKPIIIQRYIYSFHWLWESISAVSIGYICSRRSRCAISNDAADWPIVVETRLDWLTFEFDFPITLRFHWFIPG